MTAKTTPKIIADDQLSGAQGADVITGTTLDESRDPAATPAPRVETPVDQPLGDDVASAVIVANAPKTLPTRQNKAEKIIVVQTVQREAADSSPDGEDDFMTHRNGSMPAIKRVAYPKGADAYFRLGAEAEFGEVDAPVITVGAGGLYPAGAEGFATRPDQVHTGGADPVYAAANWAANMGAKKVRVVGLDDEQKASLEKWFLTVEADRRPTIA